MSKEAFEIAVEGARESVASGLRWLAFEVEREGFTGNVDVSDLGLKCKPATPAEPEAAKPWTPIAGQVCAFIKDDGEVAERGFDDDRIDRNIYAQGNIRRTREEAEKVVAKRKAEASIRRYIAENGLEFTPDWKDSEEDKHFIVFYHKEMRFRTRSRHEWQYQHSASFHFASEADAEQVIRYCEAELKIIFEVAE